MGSHLQVVQVLAFLDGEGVGHGEDPAKDHQQESVQPAQQLRQGRPVNNNNNKGGEGRCTFGTLPAAIIITYLYFTNSW